MEKSEWEEALVEMKRLKGVAESNVKAAQKQLEELEFNISNYQRKIETFK